MKLDFDIMFENCSIVTLLSKQGSASTISSIVLNIVMIA